MRRSLVLCVIPAFVAVFSLGANNARPTQAAPRLAHMVFFSLKDHSKETRSAFVASCEKYLTGHEGTASFSVGTIAEDVVEPVVSVRDFDVALHVVFENKAARDNYLKDPRHVEFVKVNRDSFAQVRVLDSYLSPEAK